MSSVPVYVLYVVIVLLLVLVVYYGTKSLRERETINN